MRELAAMRNLDVWYARIDVDDLIRQFAAQATAKQVKQTEKDVAHARTKDSLKAFGKLTRMVEGEPRIASDPPLIVPLEELVEPGQEQAVYEAFQGLMRSYKRTLPNDRRRLIDGYRFVHAARKVVGVGSVGTRAWIALMVGRDHDDPLFLQAKEAELSVLEPSLGKSEFASHGQRIVEGQRLMQAASDIMLGWLTTEGLDGVTRDFYVRQLWDQKGSAEIEAMNPNGLAIYAEICGWTLARAHARSGDAVAIAGYLGTSRVFDEALARFAETYADQNERDYDALKEAVKSGRVVAEPGM
jgi:uncharacterized protein (DUF2252 family)